MVKRNLLKDSIGISSMGIQAMLDDEYRRTYRPYKIKTASNIVLKCLSVIVRFLILFPFRLLIFLFILGPIMLISLIYKPFFIYALKVINFGLGLFIVHVGEKKRLDQSHVYVANHTSFLDYLIISSHKFPQTAIGQSYNGIYGAFSNFISKSNNSVFFERTDKKDKDLAVGLIKQYMTDDKSSLLIFPEGKCNNNKYSTLFFKGSFGFNIPVIPVAIKFKKNLVSPVWSKNMFPELLYLLTRWRIDVIVTWFDPTKLEENETTTEFSHRIKTLISNEAELKNTLWNGFIHFDESEKQRTELKDSFIHFYSKIRNSNFEFDQCKDYLDFYYPVVNLKNQNLKKSKIYFDRFSYEDAFLEVNKELLRKKF
ncbi:GPAT4 [Hepatospora eriocheir]|uniref:GPAT4 n=1 Tax=Hepatospora eriocheir TaxID=1081669 RepID=A0A1X0Q8N2_9MICR|nr:GPAT4 [Hepatospora eriocheir]